MARSLWSYTEGGGPRRAFQGRACRHLQPLARPPPRRLSGALAAAGRSPHSTKHRRGPPRRPAPPHPNPNPHPQSHPPRASCAAGWAEDERAARRAALRRVLDATVAGNAGGLHYYQGLHDIAAVLLFVCGERAAHRLLRALGACHLRDCTRPDLAAATESLRLLYPILQQVEAGPGAPRAPPAGAAPPHHSCPLARPPAVDPRPPLPVRPQLHPPPAHQLSCSREPTHPPCSATPSCTPTSWRCRSRPSRCHTLRSGGALPVVVMVAVVGWGGGGWGPPPEEALWHGARRTFLGPAETEPALAPCVACTDWGAPRVPGPQALLASRPRRTLHGLPGGPAPNAAEK